jgi:translation initiation factor IF-2
MGILAYLCYGTSTMIETRPPVVGIFGHIDHGKSTLLEYIRQTNITNKEAGGITQHISAYEVIHKREDGRESRLTFLDTPGHEAFRGIRTKGASVADVAILVVSAEDGVKPQTLEALKQIQDAKTPFIVAINKTDKPSADIGGTKQDLAENGVYVEGFGGNVSAIPISAKTGAGISDLLETVLLMADLEEFTGERDENGSGIIIESQVDPRKGINSVGVIKNGTVRRGMFIASVGAMAPLRLILDIDGNNVEELSFSSPIQILGWTKIPPPGSPFKTFLKKDEAVEYATRAEEELKFNMSGTRIKSSADIKTVPIVIKADTAGCLEAITQELNKLKRERIEPQFILTGIGTINENDVKSALVSPGAVIIGFNTKTDASAAALAERTNIPIFNFSIIYELTEKVNQLILEREPRIEVEEVAGRIKVLKIFSAMKDKQVLGGKVLSGQLDKTANLKIYRRETEIGLGKVRELQQSKVATDSVKEENEFGAVIESKISIAAGDILEAVIKVTK